MDDSVPPPGLGSASRSPLPRREDAGWTAEGGRDEIAVYREAMKAKDRRMRGLPVEDGKSLWRVKEMLADGSVGQRLPRRSWKKTSRYRSCSPLGVNKT